MATVTFPAYTPHHTAAELPWCASVDMVAVPFKPLAVEAVQAAHYAVRLAAGGSDARRARMERMALLTRHEGRPSGVARRLNPMLREAVRAGRTDGPHVPERLLLAGAATLIVARGATALCGNPESRLVSLGRAVALSVPDERLEAVEELLHDGEGPLLASAAPVKRLTVSVPADSSELGPHIQVGVRQCKPDLQEDGDVTTVGIEAAGGTIAYTFHEVSGDFVQPGTRFLNYPLQVAQSVGNAMLEAVVRV